MLTKIKLDLTSLEEPLKSTRGCEDPIYRFYHQSFKFYSIQSDTEEVVAKLKSLAPHLPLNKWFMKIVKKGTGREFAMEDNAKSHHAAHVGSVLARHSWKWSASTAAS